MLTASCAAADEPVQRKAHHEGIELGVGVQDIRLVAEYAELQAERGGQGRCPRRRRGRDARAMQALSSSSALSFMMAANAALSTTPICGSGGGGVGGRAAPRAGNSKGR